MKKAHLRRWLVCASLRRTAAYASVVPTFAALHLNLFDQPAAMVFFSTLSMKISPVELEPVLSLQIPWLSWRSSTSRDRRHDQGYHVSSAGFAGATPGGRSEGGLVPLRVPI